MTQTRALIPEIRETLPKLSKNVQKLLTRIVDRKEKWVHICLTCSKSRCKSALPRNKCQPTPFRSLARRAEASPGVHLKTGVDYHASDHYDHSRCPEPSSANPRDFRRKHQILHSLLEGFGYGRQGSWKREEKNHSSLRGQDSRNASIRKRSLQLTQPKSTP
jgi:hypothetical protein